MTKCHTPALQTLRILMGVSLAAGILVGQPLCSLSWAKPLSPPQKSWPARDFLPPVAIINPKLEQIQETAKDDTNLESVSLAAVASPVLQTTPKINRLDTDLASQFRSDQLQGLVQIQQKVDEADLEHLWQATVEKNPVIRFSLEKLATPADLQSKQSSRFLTKTLSAMIQGGMMATTMLPGGGAYRNMSAVTAGNALQNLVSGKTQPTPGSLSATEQIQMAGLIDDLKLKLIHTYQDYKNTLQALAQSHEVTVKKNALYSQALGTKNDLALMASGTAYYQALMNETALHQKAKLYRLELERLAGQEAVSNLELAIQVDPNAPTTTASTEPVIGPAPAEEPASVTTPAPLSTPPVKTTNPPSSKSAPAVATPLPSNDSLAMPLPIGPEEPIGPELPPPKIKHKDKTTDKQAKPKEISTRGKQKPMAMPLELTEPMEIGPSLNQETHTAFPLPKAQQVRNQQGQTLAQTGMPVAMPLPLQDQLPEPKENYRR